MYLDELLKHISFQPIVMNDSLLLCADG